MCMFRQDSQDSASFCPVHPVNPVQENEKGEDAGIFPCPPLSFSTRCYPVRAPQAWRFLRFGAEAPDLWAWTVMRYPGAYLLYHIHTPNFKGGSALFLVWQMASSGFNGRFCERINPFNISVRKFIVGKIRLLKAVNGLMASKSLPVDLQCICYPEWPAINETVVPYHPASYAKYQLLFSSQIF